MAALRRRPVLIVGGGPVGLYASVLLSRAGVPSVLLERSERSSVHPRAHLVNTRSMELLREVGLEAKVEALAPPIREWSHFRYCHSLLGRQIAADDHMAKPEWAVLADASPTRLTHVSQPGLEALLREEAERLCPMVGSKLLFGYECTSFDQPADGGVRLRAQRAPRRTDAQGNSCAQESDTSLDLELEGCALLACDGAHSRVRQALGIQLKGNPPLQYFKSVHFRCPSLYHRLRDRPAMLYFVFHEEAVAVLVAHHMQNGEWVAQLPFFPPLQDGSKLNDAECKRIINAIVGAPVDDLEVCSAGSWRMIAAVAQRMSVGRVHFVGDAAHQFPPAGALGMNTGLQDAHNICWKLAAVHHGHANERLLSTYDPERRQVAHSNARLAVHNYERGLLVAEALGLPSSAPQSAGDAISALGRAIPAPVAGLFKSIGVQSQTGAVIDLMRFRMLESLGSHVASDAEIVDDDSCINSSRQRRGGFGRGMLGPVITRFDDSRVRRAASVVASGRSLPLLFPRHELGFIYEGPRVASSTTCDLVRSNQGIPRDKGHSAVPRPIVGHDVDEKEVEDETLFLQGQVGSRLPHHWLKTNRGIHVSSLDLVNGVEAAEAVAQNCCLHANYPGRGGVMHSPPVLPRAHPQVAAVPPNSPPVFTLWIDVQDGGCWGAAAALLPSDFPLRVVAVAADEHISQRRPRHRDAALNVSDSVLTVIDSTGGWAKKIACKSPCTALLVRPDGHVAWRTDRLAEVGSDRVGEAARCLESVLTCILRREE